MTGDKFNFWKLPPSKSEKSERVVSPEEDKSEVLNPSIDIESNILDSSVVRPYRRNIKRRCIYRVPDRLRHVNPKAYTPQLLLIGPLHLSLKTQALKSFKDYENTKFIGYLYMEQYKKNYLTDLVQRLGDENISNELKNTIKKNEEIIRASYSEPIWLESQYFVEMILYDSVFILECFLKYVDRKETEENDDVFKDETFTYVLEDLVLLENQLPYFILQTLFDPIVAKIFPHIQTFRNLTIGCFGFQGKIDDDMDFKHFTDLFRCVHVKTLRLGGEERTSKSRKYDAIDYMYSVEELENAGVKVEAIDKKGESLEVRFEKGCLKLPYFHVHDGVEMTLRNIMALEQCHYPYQAYVCNFVKLWVHLIKTTKDVELLLQKGIIKNWVGDPGSVAEMVSKLSLGVVQLSSCYYNIATETKAYCENRNNRSLATLKRVYFRDRWTGTATVTASLLLVMTLIQTVASIIQVLQK